MKKQEVVQKLRQLFEEELGQVFSDGDFLTLKISELNLDSVAFVKLLVQIEFAFDMEFEDDMLIFQTQKTVEDMVCVVLESL